MKKRKEDMRKKREGEIGKRDKKRYRRGEN